MQKQFSSFGKVCQILTILIIALGCATVDMSAHDRYYKLLDIYNQQVELKLAQFRDQAPEDYDIKALNKLRTNMAMAEEATALVRSTSQVPNQAGAASPTAIADYNAASTILLKAITELNDDYWRTADPNK